MGLGFFGIFMGGTSVCYPFPSLVLSLLLSSLSPSFPLLTQPQYLVDTFPRYGASAISVNTLVRSAMEGGFFLFTNTMSHKLGVEWAASLLGSLLSHRSLFRLFSMCSENESEEGGNHRKDRPCRVLPVFPTGVEALPSRSANNHR